MINKVRMTGLRGIREGVVDGLSCLSILVGPNNSGKSTVLEAIAAAGAVSAKDVFHRLLRRGGPTFDALERIFRETSQVARIETQMDQSFKHTILKIGNVSRPDRVQEAKERGLSEPMRPINLNQRLNGSILELSNFVDEAGKFATDWLETGQVLPASAPSTVFVDVEAVRGQSALEDAYSILEEQRSVGRVVKALQRAMPRLTDLRILRTQQSFVLHAICGDDRPVPAYLAGDGFKRFLDVAAAVYGAGPDGVVLLEEPECFQHPRYLSELATMLRNAAAGGAQIILSTHSMELIDLLLEEEPVAPHFPTVHRLRLVDGTLHAIAANAEDARRARFELLQDLRS